MGKRVQFRRVFWLAMLLAIAFAGLGYRLVDIQVLRHEKLSAEAVKNTRRSFLFEPRRGDILDVKGNQLATSQFVKTVFADPSLIGDRQADVAKAIAQSCRCPRQKFAVCLSLKRARTPRARF